jgi:hypothetical protein
MNSDVELKSAFFWSRGRRVYSHSGALTVALNVTLPLAAFVWLLVGASRGGWKVDERWLSRWRFRSVVAATGLGLIVFLLLPKVEVETQRIPPPFYEESADWKDLHSDSNATLLSEFTSFE